MGVKFAKELIKYRRARHWTQQALSDATSITRMRISNLEGGVTQPTEGEIKAFEFAFALPENTLVFPDDEKAIPQGDRRKNRGLVSAKDVELETEAKYASEYRKMKGEIDQLYAELDKAEKTNAELTQKNNVLAERCEKAEKEVVKLKLRIADMVLKDAI